jgi:hypothetical protein
VRKPRINALRPLRLLSLLRPTVGREHGPPGPGAPPSPPRRSLPVPVGASAAARARHRRGLGPRKQGGRRPGRRRAPEDGCQVRAHGRGSHQVRESLLPGIHPDGVADVDEEAGITAAKSPPASARAAIRTARLGANAEVTPATVVETKPPRGFSGAPYRAFGFTHLTAPLQAPGRGQGRSPSSRPRRARGLGRCRFCALRGSLSAP